MVPNWSILWQWQWIIEVLHSNEFANEKPLCRALFMNVIFRVLCRGILPSLFCLPYLLVTCWGHNGFENNLAFQGQPSSVWLKL